MKNKIDVARCLDGMINIYVIGVVGNSKQRQEAISDAIIAIQKDGTNALKREYIGVKQYSGFGDQREDHGYGMCPRHGSIVFEIGRHSKCESVLGSNEIYYLECERDFSPMLINKNTNGYDNGDKKELNLGQVLRKIEDAQFTIEECQAHLNRQEVETHDIK